MSSSGIAEAVSDVGDWVWGLIQGNFNEQQSISQLLVDAVIGMIPVVGDITAVRDLIAVILKLVEHPEKRKEVLEWVTLVVLCFALIPVAGGVIKGVGKLVMRVGKEAINPELLKAIIAVINRFGKGDAVAWFKALELTQYTSLIKTKFAELLNRIDGVLASVAKRYRWVLPNAMLARMKSIRDGIAELRKLADSMIPQAIKDLSEKLKRLQQLIYKGEWEAIPSSLKSTTREVEARLADMLKDPRNTKMWKKMPFPPTPKEDYVHAIKWPDLRVIKNGDVIPTFSGKITPKFLAPGTKIRRVITTGNLKDNPGLFWMLASDMPKSGPAWRKDFAVLDDWNINGSYIEITVPPGGLHVWEGKVASQLDKNLASKAPGQYLEGGASQLVIDFRGITAKAKADGDKAMLAFLDQLEKSPHIATNWTGLMGINVPDKATDTIYLGAHEVAGKTGAGATEIKGAVKAVRPTDDSGNKH